MRLSTRAVAALAAVVAFVLVAGRACPDPRPTSEGVEQLGPGIVGFEDPPGLVGDGSPSLHLTGGPEVEDSRLTEQESTGSEVEGPKFRLEIHVEPATPRPPGTFDGRGDKTRSHAGPSNS